jgi:hypothetical protein
MISITHDASNIMALVTATTQADLDEQIRDVQRRYREYVLMARDEATTIDGRLFVVLTPTVDLF